MKTKENKFVKWIKSISYAILPFLIWVVLQALAWGGNQLIYTPGVNHPWLPIDKVIPTVSWFIFFYYLTFPVGLLAYFYCVSVNKKRTYEIAVSLWIMTFISGLFYYFYPTEMIKPIDTYEVKSLADRLLVMTWKTGNPNCCLPSGHCMMALGSFLCVYDQKDVKWWVRLFISFSAVMTFLATLFCRQHYILDCITTLVIMLTAYIVIRLCKVGEKMENRYCKKVFAGHSKKSPNKNDTQEQSADIKTDIIQYIQEKNKYNDIETKSDNDKLNTVDNLDSTNENKSES